MHFNRICAMWVTIVGLTLPVLFSGFPANAQTAACCLGEDCQVLEQAQCENGGGNWLGDLNPPNADCSGDPCLTGACCQVATAGLQCDDDDAHDTVAECLVASGAYHGGSTCANNPCVVCPFGDAGHCQIRSDGGSWLADRAMGVRAGDDFRPPEGGETINRVCYWHSYWRPAGGECANIPDDGLSIRFYEDAFGLPGTELPDSPGENVVWDVREKQAAWWMWFYSAPIDPGVQVNGDACYWIEITGLGDPDCGVHWARSRDGNNYMVEDNDVQWGLEDIKRDGLAFCLDVGITPAVEAGVDGGCGDLPVACCRSDNSCDDTTFSNCIVSQLFFPRQDCADISCTPPNDNCADATSICDALELDPDVGYCANDDRLNPGPICSRAAPDCYDGSPCRLWAYDTYQCSVETDNIYATTDGPPDGGDCFGVEGQHFQADIWYRITAPCTGNLVIDMCSGVPNDSWYNAKLAIYSDHTSSPSCPGESNADLLDCSDYFCSGGMWGELSGVQAEVLAGAGYLIRVGGHWSPIEHSIHGRAELDIGFLCDAPLIPPGLPADPEHLAPKNRYVSLDLSTNADNSVAYKVTLTEMNRCAGDTRRSCSDTDGCPNICTGDSDQQCADDGQCAGAGPCIPSGPCAAHSDVGSVWYIDTPFEKAAVPNDDMVGEYMANLVAAPVFRVWSEDTVHVTACEIVPAAVYDIAAVDQISRLPSAALTIGTIGKPLGTHYGDVVGIVTGGVFTPPQGVVSVTDVSAYLIGNQGGAPGTAPPHTTWVDLHGTQWPEPCTGDTCTIPQAILNISDLGRIKFGFLGVPYNATPGQEDPGDCP